jgi:hypothetical protein
MNYQKHYDLLIFRALNRNTNLYTEKHHIIPKCLGGTNDKFNLVRLTPEEHYVAHQLLVKIYPNNNKIIFAAHRMSSGNSRNNKLYGWIRRLAAEEIGKLHQGKIESAETRKKKSIAHSGKKKTEETREKMKIAQQNRSLGVRKNMSDAKMGHTVSDETKEKLRQCNLGKKHTEETKMKMRDLHNGDNNHFFGKTHSEESKKKMREWHSKRPPISEETKKKISETFRKKREEK